MITSNRPETATIYQFPQKHRGKAGEASEHSVAASDATRRGANIEFGSSRYHDAAIQEERARKP